MKKNLAMVFGGLLLAGYASIIAYVFFVIKHVDTLGNYIPLIVFEAIGFILLAVVILAMTARPLKIGFAAPLILLTVIYSAILNGLNIYFVADAEQMYFVLMNAVLLLVYGIVCAPIFIMGKKNNEEES